MHAANDSTIAVQRGLLPNCAVQVVAQICNEHAERYLLAFAYGYFSEHDLLKYERKQKSICSSPLNLVDCTAYVGAQPPA